VVVSTLCGVVRRVHGSVPKDASVLDETPRGVEGSSSKNGVERRVSRASSRHARSLQTRSGDRRVSNVLRGGETIVREMDRPRTADMVCNGDFHLKNHRKLIHNKMFTNAVQAYSAKYPNDIRHKDNHLFWLENDILLELNDNVAMLDGIQPKLQKAFPNKSCMQINEQLDKNKTASQIQAACETLWRFLPEEGKASIVSKHS
jgi:hypothetical protein